MTLDARDFGADPARQDNEIPINAAIASAAATASGTVVLTERFAVSARVEVFGGVTLTGLDPAETGIHATWNEQSQGPSCVVYLTGGSGSIERLTITGLHDGSPTGKAGSKGVTGLIVQDAHDFRIEQVTSENHTQMGMRIVGSSHGYLKQPRVRFTGRDGLTLFGQNEMSNIEIIEPEITQTGDDAIAIWDASKAARHGTATHGAIAAGSNALGVDSTASLSVGDPIFVAGAFGPGIPLDTSILSIDSLTSLSLASPAGRSVDNAKVLAGFHRPYAISIKDPSIRQSTPGFADHAERMGRGIVLGGVEDVSITGGSINRTVSLGLQTRRGFARATDGLIWNRNVRIQDLDIADAVCDWPDQPTTNGSFVAAEVHDLQVSGGSVKRGAGNGLVLRSVVDAEIQGGAYLDNSLHGIAVLKDQPSSGEIRIVGVGASRNSGRGINDPDRSATTLGVVQADNGQ